MAPRNGWSQYQKLVLDKLAEHNGEFDCIKKELKEIRTKDIPTIQVEIAMLKIKAGLWGAAAGAIPVLAAVAFHYMSK